MAAAVVTTVEKMVYILAIAILANGDHSVVMFARFSHS